MTFMNKQIDLIFMIYLICLIHFYLTYFNNLFTYHIDQLIYHSNSLIYHIDQLIYYFN